MSNTRSYATTVPHGIGPGDEFPVSVNGVLSMVSCPPGVRAGMKVRFRLPITQDGKGPQSRTVIADTRNGRVYVGNFKPMPFDSDSATKTAHQGLCESAGVPTEHAVGGSIKFDTNGNCTLGDVSRSLNEAKFGRKELREDYARHICDMINDQRYLIVDHGGNIFHGKRNSQPYGIAPAP